MKQRIEWIDAIKGTGIILVLLVHGDLNPYFGNFVTAGYMSLFYIASGVTSKPVISYWGGVKGKIRRLILPYLFYGFLSIGLMSLLMYFCQAEYSIKSGFIGLLYSRYSLYPLGSDNNIYLLECTMNSPLWFLTSMFTTYLFVYLLHSINNKVITLSCYAIVSMALIYSPILMPWSLDTAMVGAILVFYGAHYKDICKNTWTFFLVGILYFCLVLFERTTNISIRIYGTHSSLSIITYILLSICEFNLFAFVLQRIENTKLLHYLAKIGRMSLMLLCLHIPIYTIVTHIVGDINILKFILALCIISLFYTLVNRTKSRIIRFLLGLS